MITIKDIRKIVPPTLAVTSRDETWVVGKTDHNWRAVETFEVAFGADRARLEELAEWVRARVHGPADIDRAVIVTHPGPMHPYGTGIYLMAPLDSDPTRYGPMEWIPMTPDDNPEDGHLSVDVALAELTRRGWLHDEPADNGYDALEVSISRIPPGRPEIGRQVKVRLPESVIEAVDALAEADGVTRSAWIRECVTAAVQDHRDD